jgi:MFS family permease
MLSALLSLPFTATSLLLADHRLALLCFLPANAFGAMWLGPTGAIVQDLVPPTMRAMAAAIFIFILTIIGLGAGPQTVGILNDWIGTPDAIRYSLLGTVIVMDLSAALFFWLTGKTLVQDLEAKKRL